MKKIIILNGAGKKNGSTASLINAFRDGAKSSENLVKEFNIQDMNIKGCIDCQGCAKADENSIKPCVHHDDMDEIYPQWLDADIIVFASPVYRWGVSGQLKTVTDRIFALENSRKII